MTLPSIRVEIAFGLGPYDTVAGGDWVDVTDDVFRVTTKRGRSSEFDQFPAGTAQISLYNDSRQWDPLYTAGAHYGELLPNVPIRVVATISAVDYPIFRGFVDGWPVEYSEGGYRSEVTIPCTDATKLLAERPLPDPHVAFLNTFGAPAAWFRMDSTKDQILENVGSKGRDAIVLAPLDVVASIVPACVDGAISMPEQRPAIDEQGSAAYVPILANTENLTEQTSWSIAVTVQFAKSGYHGLFSTYLPENPSAAVSLYVTSSGIPSFAIATPGGYLDGSAVSNIQDGRPHRLVLTRSSIQAILYVDGIAEKTVSNVSATGYYDAEGGYHQIGISGIGDGVTTSPAVVLDELMLFDRGLSAAEVTSLDTELLYGYSSAQVSGDAVTAVLDLIGWPAALRAIDTGENLVRLPINPVGTSALSILQNIAKCEGGRLFIGPDGSITFHGRNRFLSETVENTVQYTFTDDNRDTTPTDVGVLDATLRIALDDRQTYDAAQITRAGGITQSDEATSTPARTYTATGLLLLNDAQALSLAQWYVFRYTTAQARTEAWTIDPEIVPAHWPTVLELDIGHRIKHDLTPGGIGTSINLEQHLEYIAHDIDTDRWLVTLNGSPTDPANYFLWASVATADNDHGWRDGTDDNPLGGAWG